MKPVWYILLGVVIGLSFDFYYDRPYGEIPGEVMVKFRPLGLKASYVWQIKGFASQRPDLPRLEIRREIKVGP